MDSGDILVVGALGVGAYFLLKPVVDNLNKPIGAASDLATTIIQTPEKIFKETERIVQTTGNTYNYTYQGLKTAVNDSPEQKAVDAAFPNTKSNAAGIIPQKNLDVIYTQYINPALTTPEFKTQSVWQRLKTIQTGFFNAVLNPLSILSPVGAEYAVAKSVVSGFSTAVSSAPMLSTSKTLTPTKTATSTTSTAKVTGAKVGTIFAGGARVVSSGASGKYKTRL